MGEVEYGWTGIKRGSQAPYDKPLAGLSDDIVPSTLKFDINNRPYSSFYSDVGIYRDNQCTYTEGVEGQYGHLGTWFCPASTAEYYDVTYESMDLDFLTRKLTPLAIRAGGYLAIVNGPADHSQCLGYGCSLREMILHSTLACNKEYDFYISSNFPLHSRFNIPFAPADCLIKMTIYNKRPNRVDTYVNGEFVVANNAELDSNGSLKWTKGSSEHIPTLKSPLGSNYHDKNAQVLHLVIGGGNYSFELKTVQSLIVEFGVMTELSEEEIYDNGNMAQNLATLLGIPQDRIKIINVISESSSARRRRSRELGWKMVKTNVRSRRSDGSGKTIRFEILPEANSNYGAEGLDDVAATIVNDPASVTSVIGETLQDEDPTALADSDLAVATPPRDREPEESVSILEKFGVEEQQEDESLDDFMARVGGVIGVNLDDFETAEERNAKAQLITDEAEALQIYKLPATLILHNQPSNDQWIDASLNSIKLHMTDDEGNFMETAGYQNRPYQVKAEMIEIVEQSDATSQPTINGKTVVAIESGNGYAVFDNLVFSGDLVSCRIKFSIKEPRTNSIAPVVTDTILFNKPSYSIDEAAETDSCPLNEAPVFNRRAVFTDG